MDQRMVAPHGRDATPPGGTTDCIYNVQQQIDTLRS